MVSWTLGEHFVFRLLTRRENYDCCRGYGEGILIVSIEKHGFLADGVAPKVSMKALLRMARPCPQTCGKCWPVFLFFFDWCFDLPCRLQVYSFVEVFIGERTLCSRVGRKTTCFYELIGTVMLPSLHSAACNLLSV